MFNFLLPLLGFLLLSTSFGSERWKELFPDRDIDFVVQPNSYAEHNGLKIPLKGYKIEKLGENLYRLRMNFYLPPKVEKHKIASGIYINTVEREEVRLNLQTTFWYRGERFIAYKTPRGFKFFDLQPKCYLKREADRWVPTYNSGDTVFQTPQGVKVRLFLTFTRCEF